MQTVLTPSSMQLSTRPTQVQPLKIVALGDSLIYGFGDPEGGGWVERLRRWWMSPDSAGHVLYNLGVRGDRIQQVAQRLEVEFRHRGELRNQVTKRLLKLLVFKGEFPIWIYLIVGCNGGKIGG